MKIITKEKAEQNEVGNKNIIDEKYCYFHFFKG